MSIIRPLGPNSPIVVKFTPGRAVAKFDYIDCNNETMISNELSIEITLIGTLLMNNNKNKAYEVYTRAIVKKCSSLGINVICCNGKTLDINNYCSSCNNYKIACRCMSCEICWLSCFHIMTLMYNTTAIGTLYGLCDQHLGILKQAVDWYRVEVVEENIKTYVLVLYLLGADVSKEIFKFIVTFVPTLQHR